MDILFETVPPMYGAVHLAILAGVLAIAVLAAVFFPRMKERTLLTLLLVLGACMLAAEAWKQWFVSEYVYQGVKTAWFFPWQLCSMAMYCSFLVRFLKGRAQDTVLVFLASFSLVAAVAALLFPGDMMRPQIALFGHSFLYHTLMVVESIAAAVILSRRKRAKFLPAAVLFLGMALVAELVNVGSHLYFGKPDIEANMFNITPYYPSNQPVFSTIAEKLGILPEIFVYLAVIILVSWGVYGLLYLFAGIKRKGKRVA
ncbi:MAG: YwaF family protein [Clostridia bacterium]|nr:YwaF family protein [Clostridia bacterium]MBR0081127.1 YwaF family protein [Clostridia bacterium]